MKTARTVVHGVVLILFLGSHAANAQAVRTFVSTEGLDNATCGRTNPCRTFAAGVAAVAAGGEVVALDSGGYGGGTIDKSVGVIAKPGEHVAIAPTSASAVFVNAPGEEVVLRGLYLNSQGAGYGVFISGTVGAVHLEDLVIARFTNSGVYVQHAPGSALPLSRVYLTGSTIRQNHFGVETFADPGLASELLIDQVNFTSNQFGLYLYRGQGSVSRSVISGTRGNLAGGIAALAGSRLTVEQCTISQNGTGIDSRHSSEVWVSNSTITRNVAAFFADMDGRIYTKVTGGGFTYTNTVEANDTVSNFTGVYDAK